MSYNLTEYANTYTNTTVGNVTATPAETGDIVTINGTLYIDGGLDEILCLECDLGARVKIEEIRYYFTSLVASGTVLSSIGFYSKNEEFENYSSMTKSIGPNYYYAVASGVAAPRFVRILHTVSGTSVSGTVVGFTIFNQDDQVDFGTTGTKTSESIATSVYGGEDEIKAIPVYNDNGVRVNAYLTLDPTHTDADRLVTIATTSGGPWRGIYEDNELLHSRHDADTWGYGNHDTTLLNGDNNLIVETNELQGAYTTRIFDNTDKQSHIHLSIVSEIDSSMITKDANREVRTIEIRSTNQRPKDYAAARLFQYTAGASREKYYIDAFRDDGSTIYTSDYLDEPSNNYNQYVYYAVTHPDSGNVTGILYKAHPAAGWKQGYVFTVEPDDTFTGQLIWWEAEVAGTSFTVYNMCTDIYNGTWVNMYTSRASPGGYALAPAAGYYILRFRENLSYSCRTYNTSYRTAWDMDCVYNSGKLWYSDNNADQIILIDTSGTVEAYHSDTDALGICANPDGGCWYISRDGSTANLVRLDENASVVTTLENVGTNTLYYVMRDGDEAFYVRDGGYLKRIFIDGTVDFSLNVPNLNKLLSVTDEGVWVWTSDGRVKFIERTSETIKANVSYAYKPAILDYDYTSDNDYVSRLPLSIDTQWQDLEWSEVNEEKYALPTGLTYHQARITLQANKPWDIYSVPTTETWTVNDNFTQANGEAPRGHRWNVNVDTSHIAIAGNRLRCYGGTGTSKTIQSRYRWKFTDETDVDMTLYWYMPGGMPAVDAYICYFRLYDYSGTGYYVGCRFYVNNSGGYIRFYVERNSAAGSFNTYYQIAGYTYPYGIFRIYKHTNGTWQLCHYRYNTSDWYAYGFSDSIGSEFYAWFNAQNLAFDVDFDNFTVDSSHDNILFVDWDSPVLRGIHLQKSIEVPSIAPNSSKDIYMKLALPTRDLSWVGSYNTNLKAWWEVPTNV